MSGGFFTPLGPDAAGGSASPQPASPPPAVDRGSDAAEDSSRGQRRKGRLRRTFGRVVDRLRRIRERFRRPGAEEEPEEERLDYQEPIDTPPADVDVTLRVRLVFLTSTDMRPDPRTGEIREVEWTLLLPLSVVMKLRALMRAGRYAEAMALLDPYFNDQYMVPGVITEIIEIKKPLAWAGAQYMLTPTDVIAYREQSD